MWWNGTPLPTPVAPIQYTRRDIEGTNSGQTLGGSFSKKVIARKEDLMITWEALSEAEAAVINQIKNSTYGTLTYYSPRAAAFVTKTMYTEDLTTQLTAADISCGVLMGDFGATIQFRER